MDLFIFKNIVSKVQKLGLSLRVVSCLQIDILIWFKVYQIRNRLRHRKVKFITEFYFQIENSDQFYVRFIAIAPTLKSIFL